MVRLRQLQRERERGNRRVRVFGFDGSRVAAFAFRSSDFPFDLADFPFRGGENAAGPQISARAVEMRASSRRFSSREASFVCAFSSERTPKALKMTPPISSTPRTRESKPFQTVLFRFASLTARQNCAKLDNVRRESARLREATERGAARFVFVRGAFARSDWFREMSGARRPIGGRERSNERAL